VVTSHHECFQCGEQNRAAAHFCRRCGQPLTHQSAPEQSAQLTSTITAIGASPPPAETARSAAPPPTAPPPYRQRRAWWPVPLVLTAALGAAALAGWQTHWPAGVFGVRNASHRVSPSGRSAAGSNAGSSSRPVSSQDPATGASSAPPTESVRQQAAANLAALLSRSVSDRSAVNAAYNDVLQCGPNLEQDAQVFQNAASSRQQLLSQLADLPSRSALSPSMLQDLTGAWQVSVQVDDDYQQWAQDQAGACTVNSTTDPNYVAAEDPNNEATADKKAFTSQWDPLANLYGLKQFKQGDL
jgi:hypothetical protein